MSNVISRTLMRKHRETKRTIVYEATELSAIDQVYVQKAALGGEPYPAELILTLERKEARDG